MPGCALDFSPDRSPVSVFAQARRRAEYQIFELAKHN
jgi:hypothetical protein